MINIKSNIIILLPQMAETYTGDLGCVTDAQEGRRGRSASAV